MESFRPDKIIEWIPYNNLQDIKYMTKVDALKFIQSIGLMDHITNGILKNNDQKDQEHKVILKKLENVENADQRWFEEVYNINIFKRS